MTISTRPSCRCGRSRWRRARDATTWRIAGAVFVLPFLLFSGYSGHLRDKVSKRSVMISVKVFEVGAMTLGLAVFFTNRMEGG